MGVLRFFEFSCLCRILVWLAGIMVDCVGGSIRQPLMPSLVVVELDPRRNPGIGFPRILKRVEMHAFVLERSPKSLHHHVVPPATLAIHADGDPVTAAEPPEKPGW